MVFFRAVVYERGDALLGEFFGDLSVTLGGPAFRSPACAGIEDRDFISKFIGLREECGNLFLSVGIDGKF